jgi:hypothetical protein
MHVRALAVRTCPPNQFYIPVSGSTSLFVAGLCPRAALVSTVESGLRVAPLHHHLAPLLEGVREAGMLLTP